MPKDEDYQDMEDMEVDQKDDREDEEDKFGKEDDKEDDKEGDKEDGQDDIKKEEESAGSRKSLKRGIPQPPRQRGCDPMLQIYSNKTQR